MSRTIVSNDGHGNWEEVTTRIFTFSRARGGRGTFAKPALGTPSTGGCIGFVASHRRYVRFQTIWKYNLDKSWCFDRAKNAIAYTNATSWFSNVAYPWTPQPDEKQDNNLVYPGKHRSFYVGVITYCVFKYGCLETNKPFIDSSGYSDGTYDYRTGR